MNQEKTKPLKSPKLSKKKYREPGQRAIEAGQTAIKTRARNTVNTGGPISVNMTENYDQQPGRQYQLNESH